LNQRLIKNNVQLQSDGGGSAGISGKMAFFLDPLHLEANQGVTAATRRRRFMAKRIAAGFSLGIAALSVYVLVRTISGLNLADLGNAIESTGDNQIALAALLTAASFLALTGYDALALRQLRLRMPYRTTALASFTSYAISFVLGFPLIIAGTVRYWIYSQRGVRASKVASLTLIAGINFWFGMIVVIGAGLTFRSEAISAINHLTPALNLLIGLGLLGAIAFYLVWVTVQRRIVRIQGFRLELPGLWLSIGQIVLGVIDQSAAAGVFYALLPPQSQIEFPTFAATYVFGCILGVASHAPGGIGVFEAAMLKAVPGLAQESLLASLLLYRAIYYIAPFILALALLGAHEAFRRWKSLREAMDRTETEIDDLG
jgi:glycosyltransferase 2 family protein